MVDVKVGDDHMVNTLQASHFRGQLVNALGVAAARITRVHEHRFPLGGDEQGGAATFRIHPINVQRAVRLAGGGRLGESNGHDGKQAYELGAHGGECEKWLSEAQPEILTSPPDLAIQSVVFAG